MQPSVLNLWQHWKQRKQMATSELTCVIWPSNYLQASAMARLVKGQSHAYCLVALMCGGVKSPFPSVPRSPPHLSLRSDVLQPMSADAWVPGIWHCTALGVCSSSCCDSFVVGGPVTVEECKSGQLLPHSSQHAVSFLLLCAG